MTISRASSEPATTRAPPWRSEGTSPNWTQQEWKYVDSYCPNGIHAGRAQRESCCPSSGTCNTPPRQGRSFLRRLITRSTAVQHLDHYIRLDVAARSDIRWWSLFASHWNGTSVTADASGKWGCGGNKWIHGLAYINPRPIVMSAAAQDWSGKSVPDNSAVVALINSGSSLLDAPHALLCILNGKIQFRGGGRPYQRGR